MGALLEILNLKKKKCKSCKRFKMENGKYYCLIKIKKNILAYEEIDKIKNFCFKENVVLE